MGKTGTSLSSLLTVATTSRAARSASNTSTKRHYGEDDSKGARFRHRLGGLCLDVPGGCVRRDLGRRRGSVGESRERCRRDRGSQEAPADRNQLGGGKGEGRGRSQEKGRRGGQEKGRRGGQEEGRRRGQEKGRRGGQEKGRRGRQEEGGGRSQEASCRGCQE